jgi:exodeoxyribonuclease VII large subunit
MEPIFDVTGALAALNQTLEYAYPTITIIGELSEFRVSKGKWVYFDIKDESSKLKCFGTIYTLKMPLEDGMKIKLVGQPRIHNLYGFSLTILAVHPVGEGSIKKAKDALEAKLEKEGLFSEERKRLLPYPPESIALITSAQSAAYADFMKITNERWPLLDINLFDVSVQGAQAEDEIIAAIERASASEVLPDVLVLIRGGGSADDLSVFSMERLTRAVAMSRIPTLVAIGHEVDESLAELVSDARASTPSNAAELLVPDYKIVLSQLKDTQKFIRHIVENTLASEKDSLSNMATIISASCEQHIERQRAYIAHAQLRIESYHPRQVMRRGYALVRQSGHLIRDADSLRSDEPITVELEKAHIDASITKIRRKGSYDKTE